MNPVQTLGTPDGMIQSVAQRHRVLRNTYALLAVSMVPTVLGAWVGLSTGVLQQLSPMISLIAFLVITFGCIALIEKNKNSGRGVAYLLAFTFFMGLMLSRLLAVVMTRQNGGELVMTAFAGTGLIFAGMATLSSVVKRDLSGMGRFLFIGLIMVLVAGIANIFLQSSALMITLCLLSMAIMSAFILVDLKRVRDGEETNYITATLSVYISIYSVFQNLLALLGIGSSD